MTKPKPIKDIEHLKKLASNQDGLECFINLAGGMIKSSKHIYYDRATKRFEIYNQSDDTCQNLLERNLARYTNIIEALSKKALLKY